MPNNDLQSHPRPATACLFALYAAGMLWLLFGRAQHHFPLTDWEQVKTIINLEPLKTVRLYLAVLHRQSSPYMLRLAYVNLVGNVVMFVPLGLFLPALFRRLRGFFRFFLTVFLLITLVEVAQLVTLRGSCDVDDLILNCLGGCMGYWLRRLWLFCTRPKAP